MIDLIRRAIDLDVKEGWARQGPYLVFLRGTARFYVRQAEAVGIMVRLIRTPVYRDIAAV